MTFFFEDNYLYSWPLSLSLRRNYLLCDLEVTQDKWYNYFHEWSKLPGKKVLNKFKSRRCSQITMLVHGPHNITVNFQETAYLSIVLSLFIHKISSKHDRDYNIQAEFKLKRFSHSLYSSLFAKMSGSGFGHFSICS